MTQNLMMAERRTIWNRLGFGTCTARFDEDEKEGFAPGALSTDTITKLDWGDRLRVLVSGKLMTATRTRTDVIVRTAETVAKVSVLPPTYPIQRP